MEAEILMSEGCDDHILLMLCVIFSQYSKVNSRWADTSGSYIPNANIQASYQDSGLKLNSSFQMWCWFKIQKTYEKQDSSTSLQFLLLKFCMQKEHTPWHKVRVSHEFHNLLNLWTHPAESLHHFLGFGEAEHLLTCFLKLFNHRTMVLNKEKLVDAYGLLSVLFKVTLGNIWFQ